MLCTWHMPCYLSSSLMATLSVQIELVRDHKQNMPASL
jgi:hypothetical protein